MFVRHFVADCSFPTPMMTMTMMTMTTMGRLTFAAAAVLFLIDDQSWTWTVLMR